MVLPLEGVTVVGLEQAVSAPLATRHLADLGARVIKVERPDGGDFARHYDHDVAGTSAYFVWANRSKESVTLDIKDPADRERLHDLLAGADVFVCNLVPGSAARLGLDAESLRARHPALIVCEISGFGVGGPDDRRKAYDLVIQAEAGVFEVTGEGAQRMRAGLSFADIAAAMYAFSGVLAALVRRATTGEGATVHISMLESLAEWASVPQIYADHGKPPVRSGGRHPYIAPYGLFTAKDGQLLVAVQNDREWRALEAMLGFAPDPRYATAGQRIERCEELQVLLDVAFAIDTADAWRERLDDAGIANGRANDMAGLRAHPQLVARDRWTTVDVGGEAVTVLRPPIELDGEWAPMGPVPMA